MTAPTLRRFITVFALGFISATLALGQTPLTSTWEGAQKMTSAKHKVYVVTTGHPERRHACVVRSIDSSGIACTHLGRATVYRAADVAALIRPGSHTKWYLWTAGFAAAAVAATWGTVVLAPVCPPCAVGTGVAALFFVAVTPLTAMMGDEDDADALLYLAPGQALQFKMS